MPELQPRLLRFADGPGPLIASAPAALGRELAAHDLLLIGLAAPARTILIATAPDLDYQGMIRRAADALDEHGAERALLIEHCGEFFDRPGDHPPGALAYAIESLTELGIPVSDALTVASRPEGLRWRSFLCTDPACCPAEGSPIPTLEPTP